ncbi:hypothetical protein SAMN02799624_00743 [Paenibacillus sp. UNC496MF]|nr:hypothetical protein SAMN02799624_00743 [Paenibacillus sp. UNC496MF]
MPLVEFGFGTFEAESIATTYHTVRRNGLLAPVLSYLARLRTPPNKPLTAETIKRGVRACKEKKMNRLTGRDRKAAVGPGPGIRERAFVVVWKT